MGQFSCCSHNNIAQLSITFFLNIVKNILATLFKDVARQPVLHRDSVVIRIHQHIGFSLNDITKLDYQQRIIKTILPLLWTHKIMF